MRRVDYTYYDGTTPYGFAGDLESATEYAFDAGGTPQLLGSSYYRYVNGHLSGHAFAAGRGQLRRLDRCTGRLFV